MSKFAIFYHNPCLDGMAAYSVLAMALKDYDTIGIPCNYPSKINNGKPYDVSDRYVIMVDFSLPPTELDKLQTHSKGVLVIDHHATSEVNLHRYKKIRDMDFHSILDEISANTITWFDSNKSGGQLALEFSIKYLGFSSNPSIELFVNQLADYDLWTHNLTDTRSVIEGMSVLIPDYDLETWIKFINNFEFDKEKIVTLGNILLHKHNLLVSEAVTQAFNLNIEGVLYPACNAAYNLANDVGNKLAEINGTPAFVFSIKGDWVRVSIRSIGDTPDQDTTKLSAIWNGGGHFNASGCKMTISEFSELIS